jgi:hypothetical protein
MPEKKPRRRPAITEEGREHQLVSLATDLAEQQLQKGTASSQVITHYLKLGSTRERLEQERLHRENQLLDSKVEMMESAKKVEELYARALDAMRNYAGQHDSGEMDELDERY